MGLPSATCTLVSLKGGWGEIAKVKDEVGKLRIFKANS